MPRLFSIEFITKDTRLARALLALEGIALGKPEITPITGAKYSGGKVRANGQARGEITMKVLASVSRHKGPVTLANLRGFVTQAGGSAGGTRSLADRLVRLGKLKQLPSGSYTIKKVKNG